MKIKYIFLSCTALLLAMGSCSKALDIAPDGKTDMAEVWKSNDNVAAYLNSAYELIRPHGLGGWYFTTNIPVGMGDDAWDADAEVETTLHAAKAYNGVGSSADHPMYDGNGSGNASWGLMWQGIRKCNVFLEHIDDAVVTKETDRARWKAETRGLRAYYYSELLRYYGPQFPYLTYSINWNDDFSGLRKNTTREIVDAIIADCDAVLAEENIPWRPTGDGDSRRVHKALAAAMKSRYTMYAASPLFATGQADAMTWEEAYQVNKTSLEQLEQNGYALYTKCTNPSIYDEFGKKGQVKYERGAAAAAAWHEYMCTGADYNSNPRDKETIWEGRRSGRNDIWNIQGIGFQGGYKTGLCPTQELVDAYENVKVVNGELVASYNLLSLDKPYLDERHKAPNFNQDNTIYNEQYPYENKDPRFYATVVYNDCTRTCYWKNVEVDGRSGMTYGPGKRTKTIWTNKEDNYTGIHANSRQQTRTGYYHNKFLIPDEGDAGSSGGAPMKFFRLSEVILNAAECAINAGHVEEGLALVNRIRERAAMPALPLTMDMDEALLKCKNERRIEFAFEEYRYDDIRRWQKPNGDLRDHSKWLTGMEISWQGQTDDKKDIYSYTRINIRPTARRNWENKWLWLPVPLDEQSKMETLTGQPWQNPGW